MRRCGNRETNYKSCHLPSFLSVFSAFFCKSVSQTLAQFASLSVVFITARGSTGYAPTKVPLCRAYLPRSSDRCPIKGCIPIRRLRFVHLLTDQAAAVCIEGRANLLAGCCCSSPKNIKVWEHGVCVCAIRPCPCRVPRHVEVVPFLEIKGRGGTWRIEQYGLLREAYTE